MDNFLIVIYVILIVVGINETTYWSWKCKDCDQRFYGSFFEFLDPRKHHECQR